MRTLFRLFRHVWKAGAFSPTAFITRALLIAALFGISELAGLREYTTFLSGTSANPNLAWQTAALYGLIHLLLYVGVILLTPVFLVAAGVLGLFEKLARRKPLTQPEGSHSTQAMLNPKP